MPHTSTDDVAIYYEVAGDPGDPPVVLISGGGAQLLSWHEDLVALFIAEGLRVVRFDNRDTGLSPRFGGEDDLDGGYGMEEMAQDVVRILDDLGAASATLVGHSMGGIIAQVALLEHPDRVRGAALVSTIPGRDPRFVLHDPPVFEVPRRYGRDEVGQFGVDYAHADSTGRFPVDEEWHRRRAVEAWDRGYAPEGFLRQWSALYRAPERLERLRGLEVPVFVMHGRDDAVLHWSAGVAIAEAMPHAELQIHPGMGHLIPRELWPDLVAAVVRLVHRGADRLAR